ncbi:MAG: VanZ family protein [Eubacteriaceae bacterium]|nr:VanZ family protein [Eubacteriaceae bacterium]
MTYIETIKTGLMVFPFLAAAFTVPYAVSQYHKYGSVNRYRTLIVYSFMLYMLISYFMVILPLPDRESVAGNVWRDHLNLIPFRQIWLYWKDKPFTLKNILSYLTSFNLWQLLFNILLTVPFGVYLRYYFRQDLKHTALYSFLLSLFFELTQISALYGIYPGPYRLADVEDLICNTMGGALGYQIAYVFTLMLPARDKIDADSVSASKTVTGRRRLVASFVDFCLSMMLYTFMQGAQSILDPDSAALTDTAMSRTWSFFVVFCLLQVLLTKGYTVGHAVCRMRLSAADGKSATVWQMVKRYFILWCFIDLSSLLGTLLRNSSWQEVNDSWLPLILITVSDMYLIVYFLRGMFGKQQKPMPHDRWSGTAYVSSIGKQNSEEA